MASNTPKDKPELIKSYSSTIMESSGSSAANGSSSGDLTSRNHSRDENANREGSGISSAERRQSSGEQQGNDADKKPHFHQTLSMEEGIAASSRVSGSYAPESSLLTWSFYLLLGGIFLGLALPNNPVLPSHIWQWATLSNIVGYTYFLAWSASFYPQIFLNYHRRTTRGLSVDFCVLNVLGYICYTIYTTNFYWNENVIKEYRERRSVGVEGGKNAQITVQGNDVAFAIHAILMATITLSQIGLYDTFVVRPPSRRIYFVLLGTISFCILYLLSTWFFQGHVDVLGFLYVLGTIKIGVTIGKYVPQALLNRSRKSTVGWNHWNVILDLTGGVLSLLQLIGDCADMRDWTGITGNPAKIALSLVTICFDLIFLVQHFILYPDVDERPSYSPLPGVESTDVKG